MGTDVQVPLLQRRYVRVRLARVCSSSSPDLPPAAVARPRFAHRRMSACLQLPADGILAGRRRQTGDGQLLDALAGTPRCSAMSPCRPSLCHLIDPIALRVLQTRDCKYVILAGQFMTRSLRSFHQVAPRGKDTPGDPAAASPSRTRPMPRTHPAPSLPGGSKRVVRSSGP